MKPDNPMRGMAWSMEEPGAPHPSQDAVQLRYWLSQSPAARLAKAQEYRLRMFRAESYALKRSFVMLPPLVPPLND